MQNDLTITFSVHLNFKTKKSLLRLCDHIKNIHKVSSTNQPVLHNPITTTANGTDCNRCEFEDYRSRFSTSQLFPFFFVFIPTECYGNGKASLSCVSFRLENEKSFGLNSLIAASVVRIQPDSRTRARTAKQFSACVIKKSHI